MRGVRHACSHALTQRGRGRGGGVRDCGCGLLGFEVTRHSAVLDTDHTCRQAKPTLSVKGWMSIERGHARTCPCRYRQASTSSYAAHPISCQQAAPRPTRLNEAGGGTQVQLVSRRCTAHCSTLGLFWPNQHACSRFCAVCPPPPPPHSLKSRWGRSLQHQRLLEYSGGGRWAGVVMVVTPRTLCNTVLCAVKFVWLQQTESMTPPPSHHWVHMCRGTHL